jgi:hypothetical protein
MLKALQAVRGMGDRHPLARLLFSPDACTDLTVISKNDVGLVEPLWNPRLNESQREAVRCALAAPAVSLIHGPVRPSVLVVCRM